jgi:hypothetical protein
MEATDGVDTYFYIHTLAAQDCGQFGLLALERVVGRHPVQAGRLVQRFLSSNHITQLCRVCRSKCERRDRD